MTDRLKNLDKAISYLLTERGEYAELPSSLVGKQLLLRALMNIREPHAVSNDFFVAQDAELKMQREEKGDIRINTEGLVLWQGDITRLAVDAIVNAANSKMLGCFAPLHNCIDNAIHSASGVQLREACNALMKGSELPTGQARITLGYNLPAKHVIHTVGPIISDRVPTAKQKEQLASCYRSCLDIAEKKKLQSIAFCCISTGVFLFPNRLAAEIAIDTVRRYPCTSVKTIVFNVFKDIDYEIYRELLS